MTYGCVLAYLLLSVYHIFFQKNKRRTKPLLAPMAALCHLCAARVPNGWALFAFALCCAGDVLLMGKGAAMFRAGGGCFLCALLVFAWVFALGLPIRADVFAVAAAMFAVCMACAMKVAKQASASAKAGRKLWSAYLSINSLDCAAALANAVFLRSAGGWVSFTGACLFFVSDCFLCLKLARKSQNASAVMLTYTGALLLIALGTARV